MKQYISQQAQSPSTAKMTALGIYISVSLFFLMGTILEFAVVLYLQRKQEYIHGKKKRNTSIIKKDGTLSELQLFGTKLDSMAFIFFMSSFILFNMVYWIYYSM